MLGDGALRCASGSVLYGLLKTSKVRTMGGQQGIETVNMLAIGTWKGPEDGSSGLDLVHVQALSDDTHLRATTSAPTTPAAAEAEWGTGTARESRCKRVVIPCVYACACVREKTRARARASERERHARRLCSE